MAKIESIKKNKKSSLDWSVVEVLRDTANEIESGEAKYNKCIVLMVDDEDDGYKTGYRVANMTGNELVALLEIMKSDLINGINGLPSYFK